MKKDGVANALINARPIRQQAVLYTIAAVLSLMGLADAIYLTVEHLLGETAGCVIARGCSEVLGSKYAKIGFVPLASLGAIAYFFAFSFAILAAFGHQRADTLFMLLVQLMFAVTLWLLLVQAFILHAYCDYCLLSALVTLLLTVIGFVNQMRTSRQDS